MKQFYYLTESGHVVRVAANRRPGPNTSPYKRGFWPLQEFYEDAADGPSWHASWEITWGRLSQLKYIGSLPL